VAPFRVALIVAGKCSMRLAAPFRATLTEPDIRRTTLVKRLGLFGWSSSIVISRSLSGSLLSYQPNRNRPRAESVLRPMDRVHGVNFWIAVNHASVVLSTVVAACHCRREEDATIRGVNGER
jgi:hypothetical protein